MFKLSEIVSLFTSIVGLSLNVDFNDGLLHLPHKHRGLSTNMTG